MTNQDPSCSETEDEKVNALWADQDYILNNIDHADRDFIAKHPGCSEVEHQIGRYLNMKSAIRDIEDHGISGDVIEFGTWQGLSLILLGRAFVNSKTPRKFIGIDSFEGLPETSTVWEKGQFDNTSFDLAHKNISEKISKDQRFSLIKGWFNDKSVANRLRQESDDVVLVHFDADLGSSTTQALEIVEYYVKKSQHPMFFLFDDWGCHPDEVPDAFYDWLGTASGRYQIKAEKLSSTRYTRYYKIIPRCMNILKIF
ncbi:MAG: TylF/MycF/NovP-related O-methyltransferase [Bdellovibrionales bacterium]